MGRTAISSTLHSPSGSYLLRHDTIQLVGLLEGPPRLFAIANSIALWILRLTVILVQRCRFLSSLLDFQKLAEVLHTGATWELKHFIIRCFFNLF